MDIGKRIVKGAKKITTSHPVVQGVLSMIDSDYGIPAAQRAETEAKIISIVGDMEKEYEETFRTRLTVVAEIIKAELNSGSWYVKMTRPNLINGGLLLIIWCYGVYPALAGGKVIPLPTEFWGMYLGVVATISIGRDRTRGIQNRKIQEKMSEWE
jgi:hypothetical protein